MRQSGSLFILKLFSPLTRARRNHEFHEIRKRGILYWTLPGIPILEFQELLPKIGRTFTQAAPVQIHCGCISALHVNQSESEPTAQLWHRSNIRNPFYAPWRETRMIKERNYFQKEGRRGIMYLDFYYFPVWTFGPSPPHGSTSTAAQSEFSGPACSCNKNYICVFFFNKDKIDQRH